MAQPRCADGAEDGRPVGGDRTENEVAAGGPRPWETTQGAAPRGTRASGTGARGRGRLPISPVRVARTLRLLVDQWGWAVVPGAFAVDGRCSCGDSHCPDPGRHALADASWLAATSDPERVRDRWRAHPEAAVVLPVGWCFDLLEVPERGGREALGRLEVMGHRLPPVIATAAGRLLFLVSALDRNAGDVAEHGTGAPAPRSAATPRPAVPGVGGSAAAREAAARDAAAARAVVSEPEPWPASTTWLASAAGCRPETSIWVGGGVPDAPDVIVRRSGLLVAPLLGAEPPGVTRWLVPPAPAGRPLPRMEDLLGPIVRACRDAASRPGHGPARPSGPLRGVGAGTPAGGPVVARGLLNPAAGGLLHSAAGVSMSPVGGLTGGGSTSSAGGAVGAVGGSSVGSTGRGVFPGGTLGAAVASATEALGAAGEPGAVRGRPGQGVDAGAVDAASGRENLRREALVRRSDAIGRRPDGVLRRADVVSDRGAETGPASRPVALSRRAEGAAGRPGGPPRRPEDLPGPPGGPEPQAEDLDRLDEPTRDNRPADLVRGPLRTRPLERYARPVLGLVSGRGAGPGPGRVPGAPVGASRGPTRVD